VINKRSFFAGFILWGLGLTVISYCSGFSLRGSVSAVSFEIATMLTPAGMIQIFSSEGHWLRPYYAQHVSMKGSFFESPGLVAAYSLFLIISVGLLIYLRRVLNASR
jgi:hypothetical protein